MTSSKIRIPLFVMFIGGVAIATADQPWNSVERATAKFWIGAALLVLGAIMQYRENRRRRSKSGASTT